MSECINLQALYGKTYRITYDRSYSPRNVLKVERDAWMMEIPCKYGTVYCHGQDRLAVEVDNHPNMSNALNALEGVSLYQDGEKEKTFLFPLELFDKVAEIVHPRRRRHGKPENGARLSPYWFKKKEAKPPPEAGGLPNPS